MPGPGEVLGSLSGWLKLLECVFTFITLVIHRHGDYGHYIFFSTTGLKLDYGDTKIDRENLGNSTLVTFMLISIVLIIGYIIDGREYIQQSILEPIWSFLGCVMYFGSAAVCFLTWQGESQLVSSSSSGLTEGEYSRNVTAAMTMGGLCVLLGFIYLVDTVVAYLNRKRILEQERA